MHDGRGVQDRVPPLTTTEHGIRCQVGQPDTRYHVQFAVAYQRSVIVCGFLFLKILNRIDPPFDSRSTRIKSPGSPTVDESALRITSAGFNPDSLAGVPSP